MLTLQPIGYVRTRQRAKFDALHQPGESSEDQHVLELEPRPGLTEALNDLSGFTRIWLIWWFHKNTGWRSKVLPPRGPSVRRGLFATRSPHRPNPLGITPVRLVAVERSRLILGPCDLVEGTPVFDIKPYIPAYDAFPDESSGWIGEMERSLAAAPAFQVDYSPRAQAQADWLADEWQVDFRARLEELLTVDPTPHRTRRIRRRTDGSLRIGCGGWLAGFTVDERAGSVTVTALEPGYPLRLLNQPANGKIPDHAAQLAFLAKWGE